MQRAIDAIVGFLIFMIAFTTIMYYYNLQYELSLRSIQRTDYINIAEDCALTLIVDTISGRLNLSELEGYNDMQWKQFIESLECAERVSPNRIYLEFYNITIYQGFTGKNLVYVSNPYVARILISPPWNKPETYSALAVKSITLNSTSSQILINIVVVKVYIK